MLVALLQHCVFQHLYLFFQHFCLVLLTQLEHTVLILVAISSPCYLAAVVCFSIGYSQYDYYQYSLNQIKKYMKKPSTIPLMLITTLITFSFLLTHTHYVRQIEQQKQIISGYVRQAKLVQIPFQKCFQVLPELQANQKYINFKPSTLSLIRMKSYSLQHQASNISIVQDLRSPINYRYSSMLIFDKYILIFSAPNLILIVTETTVGFQIKNKYHLEDISKFDQFKMYKLNEKAVLVVYNKAMLYLLGEKDYKNYDLPEPSTITHLEAVPQAIGEFIATEFVKGMTHYRIDPDIKEVGIVKRYNALQIGLTDNFKYLVDINLNFYSQKDRLIYVLDAQVGVIKVNLTKDPPSSQVIIIQKMCQSFDSIQPQHFVILCHNQGHSTIIQAYQYYDKKIKQTKYRKIEPIFHANYLNDLHVADKYYLLYSHKNIHVFWNTKKNKLPETLDAQSQIYVPGLETFAIHREGNENVMYIIESGELVKYELQEEKAVLTVQSDEPIMKTLRLSMYGSCLDLNIAHEQNSGQVQTCKVSKDVLLKIMAYDFPREQDFSISASIIVILITVFLLVIWICLKKYKGLEREARKVLQNYHKKKNHQRRHI